MDNLISIGKASKTQSSQDQGVYIKTFGCQMNEYDSEKVYNFLSNDYKKVDEIENAKVVFVNTCSVREKGEHKLFSLLGKISKLKQKNPDMIVGVGGCVAQQEGENIIKRNIVVDFVVGTHNLSLVPSLVNAVKTGRGKQVAVDYREDWEDLNQFLQNSANDELKADFVKGARGLVSIQRGCNKNCAFCVVPTTRGPEVSRDPEEILREVNLKARLGAKEILLLGQTVNSFGKDLTPKYSFEKLIRNIAENKLIKRIRFTSPHPQDVKKEFINLYGEIPQLCPHIHLPLQSGSDRILKLMNRNYRIKRYLEIVDQLREKVPNIAITTDIIVGFPTETEEDFSQTLSIMKQVNFHLSYSFKYSRRPNTKAISLYKLEDEVPEVEAKFRLQELQKLQDTLSLGHNRSYVTQEKEVLIEMPMENTNNFKGRIAESTVIEVKGDGINVGDLVNAKIEKATPYGLFGSLINER